MTPLSANYADRHTHTFIDPQPLPHRDDLVTVHILGYEQPVTMTVLSVIAAPSEFTGATHTVFLSYAGRTYSARYYNDGTLAGLGRATTATSHDVPTTYLSQLPSWHGSSQFRRSLRRWLTAQPA